MYPWLLLDHIFSDPDFSSLFVFRPGPKSVYKNQTPELKSSYKQSKCFLLVCCFYITLKQVSDVAGYLFSGVNLYIKAIHRLIFVITTLGNDQQTAERHSVLSPHGVGREFAVRSWCELLWLHLYLDIFLPTHFQGWLLNKKIKWRAKSLCKGGEQGGKERGGENQSQSAGLLLMTWQLLCVCLSEG